MFDLQYFGRLTDPFKTLRS